MRASSSVRAFQRALGRAGLTTPEVSRVNVKGTPPSPSPPPSGERVVVWRGEGAAGQTGCGCGDARRRGCPDPVGLPSAPLPCRRGARRHFAATTAISRGFPSSPGSELTLVSLATLPFVRCPRLGGDACVCALPVFSTPSRCSKRTLARCGPALLRLDLERPESAGIRAGSYRHLGGLAALTGQPSRWRGRQRPRSRIHLRSRPRLPGSGPLAAESRSHAGAFYVRLLMETDTSSRSCRAVRRRARPARMAATAGDGASPLAVSSGARSRLRCRRSSLERTVTALSSHDLSYGQ